MYSIAGNICILLGMLLLFSTALGVVCSKNIAARIRWATRGLIAGLITLMVGVMLLYPVFGVIIKCAVVIVLVIIVVPLLSHAFKRSAEKTVVQS